MKILGIDPGTRRVGYGLISAEKGVMKLLAADLLQIKSKTDASALVEIKKEMGRLLKESEPDIVAVEKIFFSKNQKTAISVAQARGVIVLSAAEENLPIFEYSPNEIKVVCTGDGHADKRAVAKMVKLSLKSPSLNVIDDVTDALAIAICAGHKEKIKNFSRD
jgi:crossover junction endodeoxyribonuclease RuvC